MNVFTKNPNPKKNFFGGGGGGGGGAGGLIEFFLLRIRIDNKFFVLRGGEGWGRGATRGG